MTTQTQNTPKPQQTQRPSQPAPAMQTKPETPIFTDFASI
ncbi:hypothetical protein DFP92_10977 [Yoonia sediminilitoris]|uniref:Uncharacterized protein n=1 Tax=Yoonia sediminilitoris TaxID=1286148 RepID=A0A2T6KCS8_9RHOB|nr:hypothetical protein C8N45_10977 [Yoonia sediminilitoris]RCW94248.1 hypothetical protein DFP92_10977 [Yoonia sediminilitoris]